MHTLYISLPEDSSGRGDLLCDHLRHLLRTHPTDQLQSILLDQRTPASAGLVKELCAIIHEQAIETLHEATIMIDPRLVAEDPDILTQMTTLLPDLLSYRYSFAMQTRSSAYQRHQGRTNIMYELRSLFRLLASHKAPHYSYTMSMVACGSKIGGGDRPYLWSQPLSDLRDQLLGSGLIDSWMVGIEPLISDDETHLSNEYARLQQSLITHGYTRYNLHHYAYQGKYSHHQATYDAYLSYGGVGPGAVSMDSSSHTITRLPDSPDSYDYTQPIIESSDTATWLVNAYIQRITSHIGIDDHAPYAAILVPHYESILPKRDAEQVIIYQHHKRRLASDLRDSYDSYIRQIIDPAYL